MRFINKDNLPLVDNFLRLYSSWLHEHFGDRAIAITFRTLPDRENEYRDVIVRLHHDIYISVTETGRLGLSVPELFAVFAHEIGHIVYGMQRFGVDAEFRADSLAAEMGLGMQMISVIEKIIASRRFREVTGQLVQRIQYLQHIA